MEEFVSQYPHLKLMLAFTLHLETMHVALWPVSPDILKHSSRDGLGMICFDPAVRRAHFIPCPQFLVEVVYDLGVCAQTMLRSHGVLSAADAYARECILSDVLQWQPEEGVRDLKETYFPDRELYFFCMNLIHEIQTNFFNRSDSEIRLWTLIFTAWKSALAVLTVRYIFFGQPNPDFSPHLSRSSTPNAYNHTNSHYTPYDTSVGMLSMLGEPADFEERLYLEKLDLSMDQNGIMLDAYHTDPFARTPSPLRGSRSSTTSMTLDLWQRQHDIHDGAWSELSSSLFALSEHSDALYLRYAMLPIMIMGLTSRPGSRERLVCLDCIRRFKEASSTGGAPSDPTVSSPLEFNIPWDRLDAYSAEFEREQSERAAFFELPLYASAPEWNWQDMLERLDMKILCKYLATRLDSLSPFTISR
jgi:hypothetical protein